MSLPAGLFMARVWILCDLDINECNKNEPSAAIWHYTQDDSN